MATATIIYLMNTQGGCIGVGGNKAIFTFVVNVAAI
jgi:hypothetical protein